MPFAEGQSVSPRVTADILHPASMEAANAYGIIIDGQPGPTWFNYQVQLCVTPRNESEIVRRCAAAQSQLN